MPPFGAHEFTWREEEKHSWWEELIGWIGMLTILAAFGLNLIGVLTVKSITYQAMNAFGAIGVMWISFRKRAYQPAVLNGFWAFVTFFGMIYHLLFAR